jgi:hypothetical protein
LRSPLEDDEASARSAPDERALCSTMTRDNGAVLIYTRFMIIASAANFWFYGYPTQLADDGMRSI